MAKNKRNERVSAVAVAMMGRGKWSTKDYEILASWLKLRREKEEGCFSAGPKIFEKLKKETPELLGKVRVISGDASLPNLGMNKDDTRLLLKEVSIVFHCAAAVNFKKPLEFLLKNNVLSLSSVIELCRKMRKFEVLVYTSTAYSNANHLNFPLKEEVYRLPFHAGQFLDALKHIEDIVYRNIPYTWMSLNRRSVACKSTFC
ncbi:Fatty acyl-CoA reductase 1 [Araneus ventricosus]|uniref:Fatty acyl-CoA reductase n=1 Tax=Araneus ventricosus TaxID=182803 RepID=A0A4Y2FNC9_ARAVE|nr:Fatty acyl-CoA reductase 1 [Araneus ventricosus]